MSFFFAGGMNVLPEAANPEVYLAFCLCRSRINNDFFYVNVLLVIWAVESNNSGD